MPSLISTEEDQSIRSAMKDLHDTFAKPIVVFKSRKRVVVSTNPNHNFLYNTGPNQTQTVDEIVKVNGMARIHYKKELTYEDLLRTTSGMNNDQFKVSRKNWDVKLAVEEDLKALIDGADRLEFNGEIFKVHTDPRPHGVVSYQFYNYYLEALN